MAINETGNCVNNSLGTQAYKLTMVKYKVRNPGTRKVSKGPKHEAG